jgi:hypothetical protein
MIRKYMIKIYIEKQPHSFFSVSSFLSSLLGVSLSSYYFLASSSALASSAYASSTFLSLSSSRYSRSDSFKGYGLYPRTSTMSGKAIVSLVNSASPSLYN